MEAEPVDHFLRPACNLDYALKIGPGPWIQIDDRVVRVFERWYVRVPGVNGDCAELDSVEKRQQVSTDIARLFVAVVGNDLLDADFRWRRVRSFLLIKAFAVDPIRESL